MKILQTLGRVTLLSLTLEVPLVLGQNEAPSIPPYGPAENTAVSQNVGFHTVALDEARVFVRDQRKKNLVPGLKASDRIADGGWHYLEISMFLETREPLQNVLFHLTKQQCADKSVYSYSLTRQKAGGGWNIINAWRTHPSGYREMLPLDLPRSDTRSAPDDLVTQPETASPESSNTTPLSLVRTSNYEKSFPEFNKVKEIASRMHLENQLPGISRETEFISFITPRATHGELRNRRPIHFVPLSVITDEEDGWYQYVFIPVASAKEWTLSSAWHFSREGLLRNLAKGREAAKQNRAVAVINGHAILESELAKVALEQPDEPKNLPLKAHLDQLITTELIVQDFKKRGGVIRDEILDQDQDSLVKGVFGGNESNFLQEIFKSGYNLSQFRIARERKIIDTYMRNFIRKSAESENADASVQTWIDKLRADAKIEIYDLGTSP
jgi:hypothetical protein